MSDSIPNFNDVLKEIQDAERSKYPPPIEPYPTITDDNVNEYILNRGSRLVEDSLEAIRRLGERITAAHDPDEVAALSQLIKAATGALGTLTTISIQNKKDKSAKESASTKQIPTKTINNTVLIGTREEAMKKYMVMASADVESTSNAPYNEEQNESK
jgi:hypothetical protein